MSRESLLRYACSSVAVVALFGMSACGDDDPSDASSSQSSSSQSSPADTSSETSDASEAPEEASAEVTVEGELVSTDDVTPGTKEACERVLRDHAAREAGGTDDELSLRDIKVVDADADGEYNCDFTMVLSNAKKSLEIPAWLTYADKDSKLTVIDTQPYEEIDLSKLAE